MNVVVDYWLHLRCKLVAFTLQIGCIYVANWLHLRCKLVAFTLQIGCIYGSGIRYTTIMNPHLLITDDKNQRV